MENGFALILSELKKLKSAYELQFNSLSNQEDLTQIELTILAIATEIKEIQKNFFTILFSDISKEECDIYFDIQRRIVNNIKKVEKR